MAYLRKAVSLMAKNYSESLQKMNPLEKSVKQFNYNIAYYPQLGLFRDDTLYETKIIDEAIRRLPREEREARQFRISRAFLLSTNKQILPKEEWTPFEVDRPYLRPYIQLVEKELEELKMWNNK